MQGPDGDKRWTAILSSDMADFTGISAAIGAERMYELLDHVLALARDCVERNGGHVVDTAGDGILAAFGAPSALENAPLQSCRAAVEFAAEIEAGASGLERRFGVRPRFRTGIGGGSVLVMRLAGGAIKVVGEPVNKAARLQALAEPGEIVISETIRREAEGHLRTADRGYVDLKGFAEPVGIHRLDGLVETLSRFDGTRRRGLIGLVSRTAELSRASVLLEAGETARLIVISGAPGIGKSRLTHEIAVTAAGGRPVYIGQCAPGGQAAAYGPFLDILRQAAHAPYGADRAGIFGALQRRHPTLADPAETARILEPDQDKQDQAERALTMRAYMLRLLRGLAAEESCLFVIEDCHWIDTASNALMAQVAAAPVPMVLTSRPGFRASWFERGSTEHIALEPLGDGDIRRIAEANLAAPISDGLAGLIAEKSEGNPLMAEEIARALRQSGRLRDAAGGLELAEADGTLLTGNLEQLVLSRVDRLEPAQKTALQYAAAIGRDFPEALLQSALGGAAGLAGIAEQPGLIEETEAGQWRFAHALIRDAVYDSMLSDQRRGAHLRIAEALEASVDKGFDGWSLLAGHLLQAGEADRSVPYLIRAARQSLNAYALFDTDQILEQAMGILDTDPALVDPQSFGDLAVCWMRALHHIGDFGRMKKVSARVLPRLEQAGYSAALSIVRTLTSIAMAHSRDYARAREVALRTLADAEAEGDPWGGAWAKVSLMRVYDETKWENIGTIERLAAEIDPVAEETGDRHLAMSALYLLSSAYRMSGDRGRAMELADRIEAFATTHGDRRARAYSIWARALVHISDGDAPKVLSVIETARDFAIAGSADQRVCAGIELYAQALLRPPEEVRGKAHNMMEEARALQDFNIAEGMEWTRVVLELRAGNMALGWKLLDRFTGAARHDRNLNFVSQCYLARAEVLLSVAGLVDRAGEAAAAGTSARRKRPGLADIAMFLALRPTARKRAKRDYESYLDLTGSTGGPQYARCQIGLGLLAAARGQKAEAEARLSEGLVLAERFGLAALVYRARHALSTTGAARR